MLINHPSPLVSIIIPIFNGSDVIEETVLSLQNQTFSDFELLIVDDVSTDNSVEIIERLARSDSRIKILKMERNGHAGAARNMAIKVAKGEFIAFTDADDLSYPNRIETQVDFFHRHPEISGIGSAARLFGNSAGLIVPVSTPEDFAASTMFTCEFFMSSLMFRSSVFHDLNMSFRTKDWGINEDWEFIMQFVKKAKFANITEPLIQYRRWDKQITTNIIDTTECFATRLRSEMLEWFGIPKTEQDLAAHIVMSPSYWPLKISISEQVNHERVENWMNKILSVNKVNKKLNQDSLEKFKSRSLKWLDQPSSESGSKCVPFCNQ